MPHELKIHAHNTQMKGWKSVSAMQGIIKSVIVRHLERMHISGKEPEGVKRCPIDAIVAILGARFG